MTRAEAAREAALRLGAAGIDAPMREARLLLRFASGLEGAALSASMDAPMRREEAARFAAALARRAARTPMAQITGRREFWGRDFIVTPDTLDPRPDSECLIGWALEGVAPDLVMDLGVGSGCLLLSLLAQWPGARGVGVDASARALAVAQRNAAALGLTARVDLRRGDWLEGVSGRAGLIVANPPYLDADDMAALQPELLHEPRMALYGGPDGLEAYRRILARAPDVLAPGGAILLEIGARQADAVGELLRAAGFAQLALRCDANGRARVLRAQKS